MFINAPQPAGSPPPPPPPPLVSAANPGSTGATHHKNYRTPLLVAFVLVAVCLVALAAVFDDPVTVRSLLRNTSLHCNLRNHTYAPSFPLFEKGHLDVSGGRRVRGAFGSALNGHGNALRRVDRALAAAGGWGGYRYGYCLARGKRSATAEPPGEGYPNRTHPPYRLSAHPPFFLFFGGGGCLR
jgi:hypothetical protein